MPELIAIPQQQVKTGITQPSSVNILEILSNGLVATQEVRHQFTPRMPPGRLMRFTNIGQRGKAAIGPYAEPGAACLQVTPGKHLRCFNPLGQRFSGARIKFIAVGRNDQRLCVAGAPSEDNQAHGQSLMFF